MIVMNGSVWDGLNSVDAICIITNGATKKDGSNVMGVGTGKEAKDKYPGIEDKLGMLIKTNGNIPHIINDNPVIVSFPTKTTNKKLIDPGSELVPGLKAMEDKKVGDWAPGWGCKSELKIIDNSARELAALADAKGWTKILLPIPGDGELSWEEVQPILDSYLDSRFRCCNK